LSLALDAILFNSQFTRGTSEFSEHLVSGGYTVTHVHCAYKYVGSHLPYIFNGEVPYVIPLVSVSKRTWCNHASWLFIVYMVFNYVCCYQSDNALWP